MKKLITLAVLALTMGATAKNEDFILMSAPQGKVMVYVSKTGAKYHTHKDCQYLKKSTEVKEISLEQAQKDGKTFCKKCQSKENKKTK